MVSAKYKNAAYAVKNKIRSIKTGRDLRKSKFCRHCDINFLPVCQHVFIERKYTILGSSNSMKKVKKEKQRKTTKDNGFIEEDIVKTEEGLAPTKPSTVNALDRKFKKRTAARYFGSKLQDADKDQKISLKKLERGEIQDAIIEVKLDQEQRSDWLRNKKKRRFGVQDFRPNLSKELLEKHSRGPKVMKTGIKTEHFKQKLKRKEVYLEYANQQAALLDLYKDENVGFIEADDYERTFDVTQKQIVDNVDITAATKHFNLALDFGPYKFRYTKNGRHLLLAGRKGHVAAFDWVTKRLHFEMNVMEEISDISWLHVETMFACAQKNWVYFYDNQGIEIHCVKNLHRINVMEFLPYHFLLGTANTEGYLTWLDVSIGELAGNYNSRLGDIRIMKNNPVNGVMCIGSGNGVVSMWSPTVREPLAKMLCHSTPMSALSIDPKGHQMATSGLDRTLKIWDIRELSGPLSVYRLQMPAKQIDISQKGLLALSMNNICEIYHNTIVDHNTGPYLRQRTEGFIQNLRFCPYEDVLGVSTEKGFTSLIVPGSCEPNFDSYESNPYQTKSQRKESEVHALLEKIPAELISLDPNEIIGVDVPTLRDKVEAKKNLLFVKPPQIDFQSRRKMKGKGGSVNAARNKKIVKEAHRKEFVKEYREVKNSIFKEHKAEPENDEMNFIPLETPKTVLDRFKMKKK